MEMQLTRVRKPRSHQKNSSSSSSPVQVKVRVSPRVKDPAIIMVRVVSVRRVMAPSILESHVMGAKVQ